MSRDRSLAGKLALPLVAGLVFVAVWRYDTEIFHYLYVGSQRRPEVETRAWYQFFKNIGYLPTWLAMSAGLMLAAAHRRAIRAGALIILSAASAAGVAELLKPIVARYRPEVSNGIHMYHQAGADKVGPYGLASSHAAVAFGAAFMLLFIYPRAGVLALILAAACAWTRLLSGAHFASDVYIGLLLGYASARLLYPAMGRSGAAA